MSHTHITAHIAGAVAIGVTTGVFDRYTFSNVRLLLNLLSKMTTKLREIRAMARASQQVFSIGENSQIASHS